MQKEIITSKQGIAIITLFLIGTTSILGIAGDVKQDVWMSIILGGIMIIPMVFIYTTLSSYDPNKDLFDTILELFGKFIGPIIILLYCWYTIHLGSLILRNITEFIQIVSLVNTPQFIVCIFLLSVSIYMVKCGIEVIGRWSQFIIIIIITTLIIITILGIKEMNFMNIKPILYNGISPVIKASFGVFSFPFAETVIFIFILNSLNKNVSHFKVYIISIIIGTLIILTFTLSNIFMLGQKSSIVSFPSFSAIRLIKIGEILERIEISVSTMFLLAGFAKLSICLLVASKGVSKLLNFNNYRPIVVPTALLMFTLSSIIYSSFNEMVEWLVIYPYYAFFFQVIIPIFMFIYIKIKDKLSKRYN